MSIAPGEIERLDSSRHDVGRFSCGVDSLDRWLSRFAGQAQRRDAARTFVSVAADGRTITGFYTVVVGELRHEASARRCSWTH